MSAVIRIATRGSALALAQTGIVADLIKQQHPHIDIRVQTISTAGDRDRISPLWKMSGSGFFTTQVEQALAEDVADIAVHSYKDLPTEMNEVLAIGAIGERQFCEDVVVTSCSAATLEQLPQGAVVGTSSPRRTALLKRLRPDLNIQLIRGNVETRLQKVETTDYDAVILARAGMERLGLADKISFVLNPNDFIPAPAQGALAIQCRSDDAAMLSLLQSIHHAPTGCVVDAERRVLSSLHPGCHAPVGIRAALREDMIEITAFVADVTGTEFIQQQSHGPAEKADDVADTMIQKLIDAGVEELLKGYPSE